MSKDRPYHQTRGPIHEDTNQTKPRVGNAHGAQAAATVRPKELYVKDCSYDLDSIFVKHRYFPPKKFNK